MLVTYMVDSKQEDGGGDDQAVQVNTGKKKKNIEKCVLTQRLPLLKIRAVIIAQISKRILILLRRMFRNIMKI
jgi:hypothetical protein